MLGTLVIPGLPSSFGLNPGYVKPLKEDVSREMRFMAIAQRP